MKRVLTVVLSALTFFPLLSSVQAKENESNSLTVTSNQPNFVPGELLVQFRAHSVDEDENRVLGKIKGEVLERIRTHLMISEGRGNLLRIRFQPDLSQHVAIRLLKDDSVVEFAEPNWIYTHQATSNDTYYTNGSLWGMYGDDATTPVNGFGSRMYGK